MYTREDEDQARRLWKKRLGLALVPMIVGLAAGITLFVVGQMRRSDTLWMATAALTVLGGGAFLFLFGVWAKPALDYLRHVERMLYGRKRETVGVLTRFSPELCERDGLWCHAMMVNLGSGHRHPREGGEQRQDGERDLAGVRRTRGACRCARVCVKCV